MGVQTIPMADGGMLIGGVTGTTGGLYELYLIRKNASGVIQWTKNYGGSISEFMGAMLENPDGTIMIAGTTYSFNTQPFGNIWLLKLDATGTVLWTKHYGGSNSDYGNHIIASGDGGYIICGLTNSIGAGAYDFYIMKTDGSGTAQWATSIGGQGNDEAQSVQLMNDGSIWVSGQSNSFSDPVSFVYPYVPLLCKLNPVTGALVWARRYGNGLGNCVPREMIKTSDGGCMMAGFTDGYGNGLNKIYTLKVDSVGLPQWSTALGGLTMDIGESVCEKSGGGYAITGYTTSFGGGGQDFYLVSLDAGGNHQWSKCYGDTGQDRSSGIIQTSDGGFLMTGLSNSYLAGTYELLVVKTDAAGNSSCFENVTNTLAFQDSMLYDTVSPFVSSGVSGIPATPSSASGGTTTIVCSSTAITEQERPVFAMYPNPADDAVQLLLENTAEAVVTIYNTSGQVCCSKPTSGKPMLEIETTGWTAGIYFVEVRSGNSVSRQKLVIR